MVGPTSPFAARAERISISGIRKIFRETSEDSINLALGQPDFPTPEHAREAAIEAIRAGKADAYTQDQGIYELREAISEKFEWDNDVHVPPENIIATSGASEALHLAIEAHVDVGEEVLLPDPCFVSYEPLVRIAGGIPRRVPVGDGLRPDPAAVEAAITDETTAFLLNSPMNPTGAVQTASEMRAFARIADEHEVTCISDEVYEHIRYIGEHYSPMTYADSDNVVVVNATSKTYSMTGWRLGWVLGSERRIQRMLRIHQYVQPVASAPAQYAAEAAISGPQDFVWEMVETFETRRDVLIDGLQDMGLDVTVPQGAFYAMPEVPDGWVEAMLENDVLVVPGKAFGEAGAGYARISFATDVETIRAGLDVMRDVTRRLVG